MPWLNRLPPAGRRYSLAETRAAYRRATPDEDLAPTLSTMLSGHRVTLHRSGREALRRLFLHFAETSGRREVAIPAYTCYSIPASAVAAGLKVRLVDVDEEGRVTRRSIEAAEVDRCAALVIGNHFGVPDPIGGIRPALTERGVALIDDAAQCVGGISAEGRVGARGDAGVLSFGRGKPLSGLGGGAAVWSGAAAEASPGAAERPGFGLLLRIAAWNVALLPTVFRLLAAMPGLGIGETHFDPGFDRGEIDPGARALTRVAIRGLITETSMRQRRAMELAAEVASQTDFVPLVARRDETGVYPRLGILAPDEASRDAALATLRHAGLTRMYPLSLNRVPLLRPHLIGSLDCPGAERFASRILTAPVHGGLSPRWRDQILQGLRRRP